MTDIGRLVSDDYNSESYAINDLGTAVGRAELSYGDLAFVYNSDTSYGIIGTLGLNYSEALGVNKVGFGQMVGDFVTFDSHTHAWLWTEAGHLVDLNTLVPSDSGWTVISATAINDAGQIVGHGLNPDGNNDAFLLSFVNSSPSPTPQLTPTPTASPTATTTATATVPPSPTPPPANISGTVTYCPNPALNPVPGVTMTLTGTSGRSTITNGLGNYAFLGLPTGGNYTVTPTRPALPPGFPGITTVDVIAIQRHYLGSALLTGCRLSGADCAPPFGVVNTADMIAVQRFFLGLTTGIGNAGIFQFNPVNRSYSALNSNQTGQNYTALVLGDVSSPYVY
jgi:probable HAF family extracellular repeat protein